LKFCFQPRPRRSGKSLRLDTIDSLFQGDLKLFEGLRIDKSGYQFEKHTVLKFNMAYDDISTKDDRVSWIKRDLMKHAKKEGIQLTSNYSSRQMFEILLEGIHKRHGIGAIILVDE
jgi:hypothetical protein